MRRIIVSGTGSHCGKTTIACALLYAFRARGLKCAAYKTGPDYIDPQYLRLAGECECYNLDTWLMSEAKARELFVRTSRDCDIALIEGAMGLYDGGVHSTAGIAKLLHAPVVLVLDVRSMGESAAAIALGFREYDHDIEIAGVIINNAGSEYHASLVSDELSRLGLKVLGVIRRDKALTIPERHLGLTPANEYHGFDAGGLAGSINADDVLRLSACDDVYCETHDIMPCGAHVRVGVARDDAFSFYYPEGLSVLEELGAEIVYFSPINDACLPDAEGYIFGGGYPEMFAAELAGNASMLASVRECERPILAECGGYMYLCRSITNLEGKSCSMAGVIDAEARMTSRPVVGYLEAKALRDNLLCKAGEIVRGHEFHYSQIESNTPAYEFTRRRSSASYLGGYVTERVLATYLHVNFLGEPELAKSFITHCQSD